MEAREAIESAKKSAEEYAGAQTSIRVEEVEAIGDGWDITLSWLVIDEVAQNERNHDPMRRIMRPIVSSDAPPLERRYHRFEIRPGSRVKMRRINTP